MKSSRIKKCFTSAVLITALMGCAATQKHETAGQYIDDSVITTRVKEAIYQDTTLKASSINVKTYQGKVQLSGFVDSEQIVKKAGEVAESVKNVTSVKNDLTVK